VWIQVGTLKAQEDVRFSSFLCVRGSFDSPFLFLKNNLFFFIFLCLYDFTFRTIIMSDTMYCGIFHIIFSIY